MVYPVSGIGVGLDAAVRNALHAGVAVRQRHETLQTPGHKHRAGDIGPHCAQFFRSRPVRGRAADKIIKFPYQRAVGVAIGAVQRQMPRYLIGQARIGFLHASHGFLQGGVARSGFRNQAALRGNPAAKLRGQRLMNFVVLRISQPFDRHHPVHAVGVNRRVAQANRPAQGVRNQANGTGRNNVDQGGDVRDVLGDGVGGTRRPGAVPVAAQIERVDVPGIAQGTGHPVPAARMIPSAVDQQNRRPGLISPVPELEFEATGVKEMGDRFQEN